MLSNNEIKRYNRHLILSEVGREGQELLKEAKVLVIGGGGLGCPVLQYLAAAGVGTIGIVDDDLVDESNLQRQILYSTADVGKPKAVVAKERLEAQNPFINVIAYTERVTSENALSLLEPYTIVVDGSDNFPTRYLVNDACVLANKILVFGSIFKFEGQVSVFNYQEGPTYRCLFPEPPGPGEVPNCSEIGVIGVLPGLIGTIQANETIKIILGKGDVLSGKLLMLDALSMQTQVLKFKAKPENKNIAELIDYEDFCGLNETSEEVKELSVEEFKTWQEEGKSFQLIDVRESFEWEICNLGGDLIPLGTIAQNIEKVNNDTPVVFLCHHGMRSIAAINLLMQNGAYNNLYNLTGGIHEWSMKIDSEVELY